MKLLKYSNFRDEIMINENLDQAKKLLRDTYKNNKLVLAVDKNYETDPSGLFLFNSDGDAVNANNLPDDTKEKMKQKFKEVKITPEENARVEKGDILKKIRELIGDKLGYAHLFTYLLVVEKMPFDDLKDLFSKLVDCKDLLTLKNPTDDKPLLRRPISNYIDPEVTNNGENLADDLENISLYKSIRKIYNELTPELKKDYDIQPPVIKKQVEELALAFAKLGMEDGEINKDTQTRLWKLFFGEIRMVDGKPIYAGQMKRFKNIREFIKSAQNYLKNIDNTETVKFYETIEKCNDKYKLNGVQVCFDEANILILEIKSFQANQMMNSHTRHCIKDSIYHWDSYVGSDDNYNKQYYIYNFNLPSYDTKSVIGITIAPGQEIRACHLKDDNGFKSEFKSLLKRWQNDYGINADLWQIFAPMTKKEIEEKKRRVIASREIVKKGLSLDQLKQYLEDGADVNSQKGQALDNAVAEGDIEKIKFLLDYGASPNMRQKQEATVNKVADLSKDADPEQSRKAFEILKLLLRAGADLTTNVFKGLLGDFEAVKFCLDNGLNPNFADDLATRLTLKRGLFEAFELLVQRGGVITRLGMAYAFQGKNQKCIDYLLKKKFTHGFDKSMGWVAHCQKLNPYERLSALKVMQGWIDEGIIPIDHLTSCYDDDGKLKPTTYKITDPKHQKRNATYQEVIDINGNLYNFVVKQNYDSLKSALETEKKN